MLPLCASATFKLRAWAITQFLSTLMHLAVCEAYILIHSQFNEAFIFKVLNTYVYIPLFVSLILLKRWKIDLTKQLISLYWVSIYFL